MGLGLAVWSVPRYSTVPTYLPSLSRYGYDLFLALMDQVSGSAAMLISVRVQNKTVKKKCLHRTGEEERRGEDGFKIL